MKKMHLPDVLLGLIAAGYPLVQTLLSAFVLAQVQQTFQGQYYVLELLSFLLWGGVLAAFHYRMKQQKLYWPTGILAAIYAVFCLLFTWNVLDGQRTALPISLVAAAFFLVDFILCRMKKPKID